MKQVIAFILFMITVGVFACFLSDPHDTLPTRTLTISSNDEDDKSISGIVDIEVPNTERPQEYPVWVKPQKWPNSGDNQIDVNCYISFPFTVLAEFLGFEDYSVPTRVCLLYYNKSGKWTILKDIRPTRNITSNTGNKTAIFGRYVIQQNYGYKHGDVIPIIVYVESATSRTHNLNQLLNGTLNWKTDGVLYLGVIDNTRPR